MLLVGKKYKLFGGHREVMSLHRPHETHEASRNIRGAGAFVRELNIS